MRGKLVGRAICEACASILLATFCQFADLMAHVEKAQRKARGINWMDQEWVVIAVHVCFFGVEHSVRFPAYADRIWSKRTIISQTPTDDEDVTLTLTQWLA